MHSAEKSVLARGFRALCAVLCCIAAAPLAAGPVVQRWHTPNGVPVMFVAAPEIPMFVARVVLAAGSAYDGDRPGLASLVSNLLGEGTADLPADDFHERLESTGARIGTGAAVDHAHLSLRSLNDAAHADPAIALVAAALSRPRFDPSDLALVRHQMLTGLEQAQSSPGALAGWAMHRAIYGKHPYGSPPEGTREALRAMGRKDVEVFHERFYTARTARVVLVGALTRTRAESIAAALVTALPEGEPAPPVPAVTPGTAHTEHIEFQSAQTHLLLGMKGISRHDPDYFPLVVGNHILGGDPVSVLFEEIREKRGLSYGASSHFAPLAAAGPFLVSLQTDAARTGEARQVLRDTLASFITKGPDESRVAAARDNLIGGFPLRIDTNSKLAEYLTMMAFYDLPADWLDRYPEAVAAVTPAKIREAFQRRISLSSMSEISVGPSPEPP